MKLSNLSQASVYELHGLVRTEKQFGHPVTKPPYDKKIEAKQNCQPQQPPSSDFSYGSYDAIPQARPRIKKFFGGQFGT
jgi:hypothetical protein